MAFCGMTSMKQVHRRAKTPFTPLTAELFFGRGRTLFPSPFHMHSFSRASEIQIDQLTDAVMQSLPEDATLNTPQLVEQLRSRFQTILKSGKSVWTPPELAAEWGVSPDKVLGWIRSGELPAINIAQSESGRPRFQIDQEGIDTFKRRRATAAVPRGRHRRRPSTEGIIEFF